MRKLTSHEIPELRAYNAARPALRASIIALKARRRIHIGPIVTMVFENTDTVRWQVTEMVRAERIATDESVAQEVDAYNALIPDAGELSATVFLELTSEEQLREWLSRLIGFEESVLFRLADGSIARGFDPQAARLTREEITSAVHFLKFRFTPEQVELFRAGPVHIAVDHPEYLHEVELSAHQHAALVVDFA